MTPSFFFTAIEFKIHENNYSAIIIIPDAHYAFCALKLMTHESKQFESSFWTVGKSNC